MSRATAEFYTPDGKLIGYGTYQGSTDLLQIDYAHDTKEEPWEYEKWCA